MIVTYIVLGLAVGIVLGTWWTKEKVVKELQRKLTNNRQEVALFERQFRTIQHEHLQLQSLMGVMEADYNRRGFPIPVQVLGSPYYQRHHQTYTPASSTVLTRAVDEQAIVRPVSDKDKKRVQDKLNALELFK